MEYNFEWDRKKAKKNLSKHKISFEHAATAFKDPNAISIFDEDHSEDDEERWLTLGTSSNGSILVICHTYHQIASKAVTIRIISGRKATKKEETQYWRGL
ncbi:MAG: BrnT family toxin [SAR324 cluster bacterium]|nr:BrnT family toxin [SAR324 cluster bacterium]